MQDMIEQRGDDALQIIWDSIKNNIFDNELTAYSVEGEMIRLPHRACPIDFAFTISEDIGLHCISAKVNGKIKALNYEIMNSDRIEIISSPNANPKPEWENFVISHKAEVSLHRYFNKHGSHERGEPGPRLNFSIKLIIRGDDRPGILNEITEAIEQTNIKRISLDSTDSNFGGAITLNVKDHKYLNSLFAKILSIQGIRSVEQEEVTD
jgi:(p)ppGpp synthase/HD superfamily hydrolase